MNVGWSARACLSSTSINKTWGEAIRAARSAAGCAGGIRSRTSPAIGPAVPALLGCLQPRFAASAPGGIDLFISRSILHQHAGQERCHEPRVM